jgi:hypothetical protein
MSGQRREIYTDLESGIDFSFTTDPADPDVLHIFARHLTTPQDAIETFFDPDAVTEWNERRRRFETRSETHVLYWDWRRKDREVRVISCFRREER